jgi:hypothetical protein
VELPDLVISGRRKEGRGGFPFPSSLPFCVAHATNRCNNNGVKLLQQEKKKKANYGMKLTFLCLHRCGVAIVAAVVAVGGRWGEGKDEELGCGWSSELHHHRSSLGKRERCARFVRTLGIMGD